MPTIWRNIRQPMIQQGSNNTKSLCIHPQEQSIESMQAILKKKWKIVDILKIGPHIHEPVIVETDQLSHKIRSIKN